MKLTKFIIACFCLLVIGGDALGQTTESSVSELQRVAKVLEKSATVLGYKTVRGFRPTDEWETEEKKVLLENHAYYTLFGEDSDGSCLRTNGRIGVTILIFKNDELARRQVDEMKKDHSGNIGFKVTKSDETGYLLEEVNGFYAAVIQDTKVIFFEDRSRAQADNIKSLVESLAKEAR
ncbi:MAG: hypothetical protein QOF62_283 [Pyrinomonadaceae bacterium]|jgi:hypothetical protein|nr:hypothetical protein [Pyrinomonadaceae bacterium]